MASSVPRGAVPYRYMVLPAFFRHFEVAITLTRRCRDLSAGTFSGRLLASIYFTESEIG